MLAFGREPFSDEINPRKKAGHLGVPNMSPWDSACLRLTLLCSDLSLAWGEALLQQLRRGRIHRGVLFISASILIGALLGAYAEHENQIHDGYGKMFRIARKVGIDLPIDHHLSKLVAPHWSTRDRMLSLQASQAPKGSILLLGDSLFEGFWSNELKVGPKRCAVVNAGFAGIGVDELGEHAKLILPQVAPRFVVLWVGMNDAWPEADVTHWAARYEGLVRAILNSGATLMVLTINPPEPGFSNVIKSATTVRRFNEVIRRVARQHHLIIKDAAGDESNLRHRTAPLHMTVDGLHPTGEFYHHIEVEWLEPALVAAEETRHESCIATA
jgi:lysophospholipase L1-like esterase